MSGPTSWPNSPRRSQMPSLVRKSLDGRASMEETPRTNSESPPIVASLIEQDTNRPHVTRGILTSSHDGDHCTGKLLKLERPGHASDSDPEPREHARLSEKSLPPKRRPPRLLSLARFKSGGSQVPLRLMWHLEARRRVLAKGRLPSRANAVRLRFYSSRPHWQARTARAH
jgi:hypothetical protein